LALPDLIRVYENIVSSAAGRRTKINLTGGEPLLRKDFFDLLRYLDSHKTTEELLIITNASLINEHTLDKLKKIKKLKQLKISLDGATEATNDLIRAPGAFKTTLEKINLIQEESSFRIVIMFTAMRSNIRELAALFELCKDLKVDGLMIERFMPLGQSRHLSSEVIDKEDWKFLVKQVCEYMEVDETDNTILPCKAFWIKFKEDDTELLGAECNLGEDTFAILPNGDLLACRRLTIRIGNLLERNLSNIINGSRILREVTDKSKLKGKCAVCHVDNCRGCRAFAYAVANDYLAEDSLCWI